MKSIIKKNNKNLKVKSPKITAGGLPALISSMKQTLEEMGIIRGSKLLLKLNQKDGFDCPGCAWPDPDQERSSFEFCENGVKAVAEEATLKKADPKFFSQNKIPELKKKDDFFIGKAGRITQPMILRKGEERYQTISWSEAFNIIQEEIEKCLNPDEMVFYTSGRASNEAAYTYQLLARLLGTNNLPDCSNMCHESSGIAMTESIGIGKGTVKLEDFNKAELILIFGQNPGTNHPRMMTSLEEAKKRGAKIISVNPLQEAGVTNFIHPKNVTQWSTQGTKLADIHVPIKINGDQAFCRGVAKVIIENFPSTIDKKFIDEFTEGFPEYCEIIKKASWSEIEKLSGVNKEVIYQVAQIISQSKATIACWAMGLTQHKNSVATIQEVLNVLFLHGNIGRPGAGACPVRGHSNVQGDRTMGIWEKPKEEFLLKLENEFSFRAPRKHGHSVVEALEAMRGKKVKIFTSLGGNLYSAAPDHERIESAFENLDLAIYITTKLNRNHLIQSKVNLILPCKGRTDLDQKVSMENSMGVVHSSQGSLKPPSKHIKSEVEIICEIGSRVANKISWNSLAKDYRKIRNHISNTIDGFANYNKYIENNEFFYLPNPPRDSRKFLTSSKKAIFQSNDMSGIQLESDQLMLMTIRSHDQYNTTIYGLNDRYRGVYSGRRIILLNEKDLKDRQLKHGDLVNITGHHNGEKRHLKNFVALKYNIPRNCSAAYFPEANPLVPLESYANKSLTPTSKSIIITIEKS